jgi:DNA-binding response OmpR family regulator
MLTGNAIILIVDTAESRSVLRRDLTKLGYAFVLEASTMEEAMTKTEEASNSGAPVSLVMWAWTNSGSSAISKFRNSALLKSTPVIMVVQERELTKALVSASSYINGYLVKPHTIEVLKESLPLAMANPA